MFEQRDFESHDGTRIAYQVAGEKGNPAMVLANGLGGSHRAWWPLMSYFAKDYRIVTWDYRGLFRSARPSDLSSLDVVGHCRDLDLLLELEEVNEAIFIGWSMGVQVLFEHYRRKRGVFKALVAINGVAGDPFGSVLSMPLSRHVVPGAAALMKRVSSLLGQTIIRFGNEPLAFRLIRKAGLMSETIDEDFFKRVVTDFGGLDFEIYGEVLQRLGEHSAWAILPEVKVPVLMIAGSRDLLTPAWVAQKMVRQIPEAELMVVRGGTHYVPLEYPELVALRVEKFLRERPWIWAADKAGATPKENVDEQSPKHTPQDLGGPRDA